MWNKQPEVETPSLRPAPVQPSGLGSNPSMTPAAARPIMMPTARNLSCLGAGIVIKGTVSGTEDLQIDGKVDGPISLQGQKLTIGQTGKVSSEISARDVIVHGDVTGNLNAQDRVEIRKDASVIGDIKATRISIEDGAFCKGRIEIDRGRTSAMAVSEPEHVDVTALAGVSAN
ncbi:MAG TPA: polymer-forming cytoskeletal protein [Candidatus Aquilonibacter sp.]|nr:polymer-forming cytoskeletal protein [Candidatus Aquilonibacter sp.]